MSSSSLRFRGACVLIFSTLLVTQSPLLSTSAAQADETPLPAVASVRIATFNTAATLKTKKALQDITALVAQQPDIITLQEMGSPERRQLVRETLVDCETCVYDAYLPTVAVEGSTPILYRSDRFILESAETVQVTEATYVGPRGAGPSTIRAKFINWVRLRELTTGRALNVLNNHTVASVQGRNGGPNTHMRKRLKIYRKHIKGLVALATRIKETMGGLIFVTGDLNVNFRRDRVLQPRIFPYYNLGQMRMSASFERLGEPAIGTHQLGNGNGTRLIDYVYVGRRRAVTPVAQKIMTGLHSDHRPLLVDFEVRPGNSSTPPPTPAR